MAPDLEQVADLIVVETNALRAARGLKPVVYNAALATAAQQFAAFMARTERVAHDADGAQPWERASRHGYHYCIVAENIAYRGLPRGVGTQSLAQGFVSGWEGSERHRHNLLDPEVSEIGVAVRQGRPGRYYAVQMLARPASARIRFEVDNRTGQNLSYTINGRRHSLDAGAVNLHEVCQTADIELTGLADGLRARNGERYIVRKQGRHYRIEARAVR
jgi:hypothetical protein